MISRLPALKCFPFNGEELFCKASEASAYRLQSTGVAKKILELTRGVHDGMVNWGTLGGSQNYSGTLRLDATGSAVTHELVAAPLVRVRMTTSLFRDGAQTTPPSGLRCYLRSNYQLISAACTGETHVPAGLYDVKFDALPRAAYIAAATAGSQDLLAGKIAIVNDTDIAMQIRTPGAIIQGTVRGPDGTVMPHAAIALVPDPPTRHAFYRSAISDISGQTFRYRAGNISPIRLVGSGGCRVSKRRVHETVGRSRTRNPNRGSETVSLDTVSF